MEIERHFEDLERELQDLWRSAIKLKSFRVALLTTARKMTREQLRRHVVAPEVRTDSDHSALLVSIARMVRDPTSICAVTLRGDWLLELTARFSRDAVVEREVMAQRLRVRACEGAILKAGLPTIRNRIRSLVSGRLDDDLVDDLVQEGLLELSRSIYRFDSSRGFRFMTYASRGLDGTLKRLLSKQWNESLTSVSLDDLPTDCEAALVDDWAALIDQWDMEKVVEAFALLSQREQRILSCIFGESPNGVMPPSEYARCMGISVAEALADGNRALRALRQSVDQRIAA
ncbi:sigma-70 family RNA polymerase sigma factor (plasmid) [Flagellatimonas centrodinii]|uniref:sigma-70 family RNA polymerase sigma factor n=1 Tax=Flagellatimonas centrodinii TaxID=2806210 RepID=UPI001FEED3BE|nr:sigma-70 family RNA polymerase sigma factor [Flagellatimonas centrodinii]ULQ48419.1 sigma-70 family RNA polymerase sigma factor [Flagellatimonas centrodinii]